MTTQHPSIERLEQEALPSRRRLVEKELLVPGSILVATLGLDQAWLDDAVGRDALFSLAVDNVLYFPAFYAHPAFDRSELESISEVLGNLPGWAKWMFFMRRNEGLGGLSPLEALEQGRIDAVLGAAHSYLGR